MDAKQFEQLLYEEESTTLDFKEEQYRFVKATDDEKSELLKDIVGFANAWRRSEAFILIGVKEVRGGRASVIGIPSEAHLDDHSLQQFVNNLTNRPVLFHYEAFGFEGRQIGILRIEQQQRPLYLKQNYGKLKRNEVYVRRGSSTDPTKPAGPDELAQMGQASGPQSAELAVEFADMQRDDSIGTRLSWQAEYCDMPPDESIPDLEPPRPWSVGFGIELPAFIDHFNPPNRDYYRELANYEFAKRLLRPLRLAIKNTGRVAATGVRVELTIPADADIRVLERSDVPDAPKSSNSLHIQPFWQRLQPALRRSPGEVSIDSNDQRYRIDIDCRDMQPGRQVHSDTFFVGKDTTGEISFNGRIFADNLPTPKEFGLVVAITVSRTKLSIDQLIELPYSTNDE